MERQLLKLSQLLLGVAVMTMLAVLLNLYTYFHFRDLDRGNREVWAVQVENNEKQSNLIEAIIQTLSQISKEGNK